LAAFHYEIDAIFVKLPLIVFGSNEISQTLKSLFELCVEVLTIGNVVDNVDSTITEKIFDAFKEIDQCVPV
jgi:hypothetical protein